MDDITLGEIVCAESNANSHLQTDLDNLGAWCAENDMLPKPEKCNMLHICNLRNEPVIPNFVLNNEHINTTDNMKLLGVIIQSDLNWDIQVNQMISKASKRMYMLYVLRRFRASATRRRKPIRKRRINENVSKLLGSIFSHHWIDLNNTP